MNFDAQADEDHQCLGCKFECECSHGPFVFDFLFAVVCMQSVYIYCLCPFRKDHVDQASQLHLLILIPTNFNSFFWCKFMDF